ncbi:hypothetical protein [Pseudomonas syringae]|uniref:Uncharacterized protein n=1 Tax=Pseudomonas syringae pv. actinidiae TaxID=103796 RepID=A0A2P0QFA5_PSESF|nr:hypothetical protein [Pseudomonas syringae]APQ06978.1 hypothetical protein PsaNZ47_30005 [Pseudomonas syringae pv. actinidiae]ARO44958.1 hypothetical protein [Pseudomonas syringae pv. actinidiae]ARO45063.1 hypothetical protein [Pseudomonas syringae pv. actinidiae]ARO45154.1 hypothetical protein [Pseudomonas syringae pv. actinidiae]MDU8387912.1 hypothetical protein [Pseudomonas syringae pv. actinidiae]
MADTHDELTKATGITADLVMEIGTYHKAKDMRSVQTGLSSAARELRAFTEHTSLRGRLGSNLSQAQRELLTNAAALLDSIKYNVEHAKERKDRTEKAKAKKRALWEREADQLVKKHFSFPMKSVTEQLQVLEIYLTAHVMLGHMFLFKNHLDLRKLMQDQRPQWVKTTTEWRNSQVSSLLSDLHYGFRDYLSWDSETTPAERLKEMQRQLEAIRAEVLARPESVVTLRIWTDELKSAAFISTAMPAAGNSR